MDINDLPVFFLAKNKKDSNFSDCQSTEEPNITQSGRKVLFVHRKLSEQTSWWNNGACWATANQRGWVLCFRESAENTKLLKRCAHLSETDDTGLLTHNAAALNRPAIGLPKAAAGNDHFIHYFKMKNFMLKYFESFFRLCVLGQSYYHADEKKQHYYIHQDRSCLSLIRVHCTEFYSNYSNWSHATCSFTSNQSIPLFVLKLFIVFQPNQEKLIQLCVKIDSDIYK